MKKDTRYLVSVALMAAIVILLANTPLGMIQLPIIKATTVQSKERNSDPDHGKNNNHQR